MNDIKKYPDKEWTDVNDKDVIYVDHEDKSFIYLCNKDHVISLRPVKKEESDE